MLHFSLIKFKLLIDLQIYIILWENISYHLRLIKSCPKQPIMHAGLVIHGGQATSRVSGLQPEAEFSPVNPGRITPSPLLHMILRYT